MLTEGVAEERSELLELEAFVHVAFERRNEACAAFRDLLELAPETKLDRDLVSPKIRKTLLHCGVPS